MLGFHAIARQYYDRYRLPLMHTETNLREEQGSADWLRKQWNCVLRLLQDGVPVVGFTWYSLTDQMDWDTALREDARRVDPVGLFDLDRKLRPGGPALPPAGEDLGRGPAGRRPGPRHPDAHAAHRVVPRRSARLRRPPADCQ